MLLCLRIADVPSVPPRQKRTLLSLQQSPRLVSHCSALLVSSPCSPARGWDGPFCIPAEPP